ncbi:hypothetical protein ACLUTX_16065 [Enterobacterales bacterium AE_CKDN230030158-1A_HGKHYDSX7]
MSKNGKVRILELKHSWLALAGALLFTASGAFAFFKPATIELETFKSLTIKVMIFSFYLSILGIALMVWNPHQKDKSIFTASTKAIVLGFILFSTTLPTHLIL